MQKKTVSKSSKEKKAKVNLKVKVSKKSLATKVDSKVQKITENKEALKQAKKNTQASTTTAKSSTAIDTKKLTQEELENYKRWLKLQKQHSDEKPIDYKMTLDFEIKMSLKHKIHGWGFVLQKRDNYIDVLFESGLKTLICNYKN